MSEKPDATKIEAALKRAAHKALHGTREERAGRFLVKQAEGTSYPGRMQISLTYHDSDRVHSSDNDEDQCIRVKQGPRGAVRLSIRGSSHWSNRPAASVDIGVDTFLAIADQLRAGKISK